MNENQDVSTFYRSNNRSKFWMRINEYGNGSYLFIVKKRYRPVFDFHFPRVRSISPTGWKHGKQDSEKIWIPESETGRIDLNSIKEWADFACGKCVWLSLNKNIAPHFHGDELDYCIVRDFNCISNEDGSFSRSELGEAEYNIKYRYDELGSEEVVAAIEIMSSALLKVYSLLPINDSKAGLGLMGSPLVSPIPAENTENVAWVFANHVANKNGIGFLEPILEVGKPKMKSLALADRIESWNAIYKCDGSVKIDPEIIKARDIVIVDDLYQSGISMWSYAKFLKGHGARKVYGLACVKSMRDDDNQ